ncbi:tyrosine-type recombinase/integrase [Streptomyces exfoliatus]|uniref:tyrosine-type recombinase/integrase n=1 Tax=Streptomyces exfoliatus TaxID=1905 RepID=UPI003C307D3B
MAGCGMRNGEAHAANVRSIVASDVYRITEQILDRTALPAQTEAPRPWGVQGGSPTSQDSRLPTAIHREVRPGQGGLPPVRGNKSGNLHMQNYFYGAQTLRWRWDRCVENSGVDTAYNLYSLRHHFASNCLTHGIPITDVADWMGHKSIEVTYRIYRHLLPGSVTRAARPLNDWL